MIVLPFEPREPKNKDPKFSIFYGKPKSGKSTICAALPNSLLIDLEGGKDNEDGGTWHIKSVSLKANSVGDIGQIIQAIKAWKQEHGKDPYDFIILDHASKLEKIAEEYALRLYQETPQGKRYTGDIMDLAQGGGYVWLRKAVLKILETIREVAPYVILIGHTKLSTINKEGNEVSEMSVDLTGKLADMVSGEADAVGYVYRKKNETRINFQAGDDVICGSRAAHIRNKDIVVATSDEEGDLNINWKEIFTHIQ